MGMWPLSWIYYGLLHENFIFELCKSVVAFTYSGDDVNWLLAACEFSKVETDHLHYKFVNFTWTSWIKGVTK